MIHKKITRAVTLSMIMAYAFTTIYTPTMVAAQQPPIGMGGQMLTPEDLQAMERAVEEERAKMTPEERAAFDNEVDLLTKELEAMKPEELEAFMNTVLFGQPEPAPQETPEVTPPAPAPTPKAEPVKPQKPQKKQDEAIARIDGIINRTNSFLNKIARYIDFAGKLKKWSEQGKITGWKQTYTWDSIKKQIEDLLNKLTTIKDKDPKTNDYKYITDLIDDESLYNNLGKLNDSLSKLEPDIEIDDFGIEPVSRQVRYVIRKVLAEYIEALTVLNINSDLDKLISKYEPTAKKYREEQEALTKKSLEESKLKDKRRATPAIVAGKGDRDTSYTSDYASGSSPYDYYPYSSGYSPSSYGSYGNDYGSPSAYQPPTPPSASSGSQGGTSGKSNAPKEDKTREDKKDSSDKESGEVKGEGKKSSDSKSKSNRIDHTITSFENALDLAIDTLKDKEVKFDSLSEQIKNTDKAQDEKTLRAITEANEQLTSVLNDLKILKKLSPASDQRERIQSAYNKQKKSLDQIIESINKVDEAQENNEISESRQKVFGIYDEKIKASAKKSEEEEIDLEASIAPIKNIDHSPYLLRDNIANVKKAYDALLSKSDGKSK